MVFKSQKVLKPKETIHIDLCIKKDYKIFYEPYYIDDKHLSYIIIYFRSQSVDFLIKHLVFSHILSNLDMDATH